ncbi:MAG TPA: uracil-DNA glycosylase [Candidatus Paceibacterota bacterium]|nr:uracil-DNA glycosylase [Candidatus Paceibacterota bacterium]HQB27249.1 uracil-DNA glycosylase [Candidatus Paceibacterota bacterium]
MTLKEKTEKLRVIKNELLGLEKSPLFSFRQANNFFPVIGEGNHEAKIMFVGEAPGRNEAKTGRPFCGAAGKILDDLLTGVGINRAEVYVTNIIKDRPPQNRDPLPEEIACYGPFLDRQIEIIEPRVIATLGRFSMRYILEKFAVPEALKSISELHGKIFSAQAPYGPIVVIPFYHPAAAIYNRALIDDLKKDFAILKNYR